MRLSACFGTSLLLGAFVVSAHSATPPEPPPSPQEFTKGAQLFGQICSHCHGPNMVNPGTFSFDLRKFPADDRERFFNSVQNGKRAMPPWKDLLRPEEIEAVWAYVRSGGVAPQ